MSSGNDSVMRVGSVVGLREDSVDLYCRLHANPWPEVTAEIARAGISNYSIFLLRERNLLFSYYEYRGMDRAAGARSMAANPAMQEWWRLCRPCQLPIMPGDGTRRWADMESIFYQP